MEQAGSVFPDLVEASMTEMRLRSKMAASCLGYSFARSQTGLFYLLHYVSLSWACIGPSVLSFGPSDLSLSINFISGSPPSTTLSGMRPSAISSAGVIVQVCVLVSGSEVGRLATAVASSAEVGHA